MTSLCPAIIGIPRTIAEVFLISQEFDKAAALYQEAIDIAPTEVKSHQSSFGQAKLLLAKMEAPRDEQDKILRVFNYN